MSNLGYKQVVNADRRTWDKEAYEARAKARRQNDESELDHKTLKSNNDSESAPNQPLNGKDDEKEEFLPATKGAAGPGISKRAFLKSRTRKVDLESKVGQSEILSAEAIAKSSTDIEITDGVTKSSTGVGWHCKVCDCFLKDSLTYLDHINGRKHQRKLGYTMRVERSTADQVKDRMADLAKAVNAKKKSSLFSLHKSNDEEEKNPADEFELMVKAKDDEVLQRKAARARKREERKKKRREEEKLEDEEFQTGIDPDMAAMMGFSSFG